MERRSSCRVWTARNAPAAGSSRQPSARHAPVSRAVPGPVSTPRHVYPPHRWGCPNSRLVSTFRRPSATPVPRSTNSISLSHSTAAWGSILLTATPTYATTSLGSGRAVSYRTGLGHFRDITYSRPDFRFQQKTGHAADITGTTDFDPDWLSALVGQCTAAPRFRTIQARPKDRLTLSLSG